MFSRIVQFVRQVMNKMFPIRSIETVEHIESPLTTDMLNALNDWYDMYRNQAPWLSGDHVKSMNLSALIASEIARQVVLEVKWNITGKTDENGDPVDSPRAVYLKSEFEKLMNNLRLKLEQGCAAGGMTIRPYPKDGHIYFDYTMDWSLYPVAFDDDGAHLRDVIFRDTYQEGRKVYTRLERHALIEDGVRITQRAFVSQNTDNIGSEISLASVPQWARLEPEAVLKNTDGQMFGWFKVASANNVDIDGPLGISVFHKAKDIIKEADLQYSRLLWEYEGSELAIDVDPTVLRAKQGADGVMEVPKLNERLFRGVDLGEDSTYHVFNPPIRDGSLVAGLNQLLKQIEDLSGLSRGTLSDANGDARTATELKILKQRSYTTVADNQAALERCLRDVVRAMDKYADMYDLAPDGEYDVSFEWDDSILTDVSQQLGERLELLSRGIIGKAEMRKWYLGETEAQAKAKIQDIESETLQTNVEAMLAASRVNGGAVDTVE